MITAIIVEDEPNAASYINNLITETLPNVSVIGIASNVKAAADLITRLRPDVVLLDVELQTATGFDLLGMVDKISFQVIFTTAHEKYALKAIKFAALDFLIKPIDANELKAAIDRVISNKNNDHIKVSLDVLLGNFKKENDKKIAVFTTKGITVVEVNNIFYFKSDGPYSELHLNDGVITSSRHLKEYEDLLEGSNFLRVHKSYLVNLNKIKHYIRTDGGHLILSDGSKIDVSDKKKEIILKKLSSGIISFNS